MPEIMQSGNYLLIKNLADVRKRYQDGQIGAYRTDLFAELLGIAPVSGTSSVLMNWAFEDRTATIKMLRPDERDVFLQLFYLKQNVNVLHQVIPNQRDRIIYGYSGNGNYDWLKQWNSFFVQPRENWQLYNLMPFRAINVARFPISGPAVVGQSRIQQLIHLTSIGQINLRKKKKEEGSVDKLFDFLDNLPINAASEHGQRAMTVAQITIGNDGIVACRLGSLDYPTRDNIETDDYGSNMRFNYAFSSRHVLQLGKGDVLFITASFMHNNVSCPALFDFAVLHMTRWLENRGVTVLFSAGGGKTANSINSVWAELTATYQVTDWPGIIIGGVDARAQTIQSNHGAIVTCFAAPSPAMPDFDESSGATSVIAGIVVRMQHYAKKKWGDFLRPSQIKQLLATCGRKLTTQLAGTVCLPDWPSLQAGINRLLP